MTPEDSIAQSYDGRESYIFISYARRNADEVLEIVRRMQAAGCRIWYDEGTNSGMEWAEHIAERVADCGYFIAFISSEYLESESCLDELGYARDMEKNRLLVYLSNVTLPDGISMRINRLQAIHKYAYRQEDFYERLFQAKGLSSCMISSAPEPECVSPQASDSLPEAETTTEEGQRGQDTGKKFPAAARSGTAPGRHRKLMLLVPVAVCILLAVFIPSLFPNSGSDKDAPVSNPADLRETDGKAPPDAGPTASHTTPTLILDPADLCGLSFGMSPGAVREIMTAAGATETDTRYTCEGMFWVRYDPGTVEFNGSEVYAMTAEFGSDGLFAFRYVLTAHQDNEASRALTDKYGKPIRPYIYYDEWDLEGGITLTYIYGEEDDVDSIWFTVPHMSYLDMRDFTWGMSPAEALEAEAGRPDPLTLTKSEPRSAENPYQYYYECAWEVHGNPVSRASLIYMTDQLVGMNYILKGASLDSVVADLTALYGQGIDMDEDGSRIGWKIMMEQPDSSDEIPISFSVSSSGEGVLITFMDAERYQSLRKQAIYTSD